MSHYKNNGDADATVGTTTRDMGGDGMRYNRLEKSGVIPNQLKKRSLMFVNILNLMSVAAYSLRISPGITIDFLSFLSSYCSHVSPSSQHRHQLKTSFPEWQPWEQLGI